MSDMKCPFCGKKLWYDEQDGIYRCMKSGCVMDYEGGTEQLWQELIRTRKALDTATKCINWVIDTFQKGLEHEADVVGCCELSIWNIEELEQKD